MTFKDFFKDKIHAILSIFFSLAHLFVLIRYNESSINDYLFFITLVVLRLLFQRKFSLQSDMGKGLFWLYFEFAFTVHFALGLIFFEAKIEPYPFMLFNFGLTTLLGLSLFLPSSKKVKESEKEISWTKLQASISIIIFFAFSFLLSYLSSSLNITKMGFAHSSLPYKLEPALNLFRTVAIPIIVTLLFHYFKNVRKFIVGAFLTWLAYESIIRGSRGALIAGTLPLLIYLAHNSSPKRLLKGSLIITFVSFFLFLGAKFLRASFNNNTYRVDAKIEQEVWDFYSRLFKDPAILTNLNNHFGTSDTFLKFRVKELYDYGGGSKFYTHEVMKIPKKTIHNEGLTGLSDGVLQFGTLGFFITIPIFILLFHGLDLGIIPLFSSNRATTSISYYGLINCLIWGTGFWDFFINRSFMTISVFPVATIGTDQILRYLANLKIGCNE